MTKADFLEALRNCLRALPDADAARSLDYYIEMIDDRMDDGMTEEEAVAAVGDPADVAREILREYTPPSGPSEPEQENRGTFYCPRCSNTVTDRSLFCPRCGYSFVKEPNSVSERLPDPEESAPIDELSHSAREAGYSLRWYRFLIWFFIWFHALSHVALLFQVFSLMTAPFASGGRSWACTLVVITVLYIAYLVFVRQALAHWKRHAPHMYLISLFMPFLSRVLAAIASAVAYRCFGAYGYIPLTSDDFAQLVGGVVFFIPNLIYFKKRAELFTE